MARFRRTTKLTQLAIALAVVLATPVTAAGVVLATQLFVPLPAVIPDPEELEAIQFSQVYDVNGELIHTYQQFDQNIPVSPGDIPEVLKEAVIAAEDRNFYGHSGVDIRGTLRALVTDVREGELAQGGSTITQQLAKNAYGIGSDRTIARKLREAVLAAQLDRSLSKEQILFEYLSIVYFGEGAYGIGAAADVYFGKPVNILNASEAATLAGLIPAPSRYNPRADLALAESRRVRVLDTMLEEELITPQEWQEAVDAPLWLASDGPAPGPHTLVATPTDEDTRYPWFISYLTRYLADALGDEDLLYRGGLQIFTTLDPKAQVAAEAVTFATLNGIDPVVRTTDDGAEVAHTMQMAVTAVEPPTGFVRAMVGGRDFGTDQTNIALKGAGSIGRQAGSAFKPFVLATAFEQGIRPDEVYSGGPLTIGDYSPQNYAGAVYGAMTLRSAMHRSVNTTFVRLMQDVGPDEAVAVANRLGLEIPEIDPARDGSGLSIALGSREVSGLGMASAYGTFATDGVRMPPTPVVRVFAPDGNLVLDRSQPEGEQVLEEATADNVTDVLEGVLTNGTASGKGIGRPAAGKTGTTQDNRDSWFVGYTPTLSASVFMGWNPQPPLDVSYRVKGRALTGGSFPAEAWQDFMVAALDGVPVTDFSEPAPIRDVASEEIQRERRGFAPRAPMAGGSTSAGGPYVVDAEPPVAPAPTTTTSSTTTTSTTTTLPSRRDLFDDD
ncbi:transglycosylase domain-containing protein [Acidimicrobiia bacterium EGI L10123]|uniref:transglycosylase domain-containing protein n=1 Tax=Salinilacustrithrix flava TaxID=2957203 RepID=UPI003D7C2AF8|nr:transglycosylase domain-containing protein [Acidimicrobiia bacterium EGI L10123]